MDVKQIPVTNREEKELYAMVDDEDFERLERCRWYLSMGRYAVTTFKSPRKNGESCSIHLRMHRLIMNTPRELDVDHINGNGLDNRKVNLRNCTMSQNKMNSRAKLVGKTSIYKGVYFDKEVNKFRAYIGLAGKNTYVGISKSQIVAAKMYDEAAIRYFGEFARPNFPTAKTIPPLVASHE